MFKNSSFAGIRAKEKIGMGGKKSEDRGYSREKRRGKEWQRG